MAPDYELGLNRLRAALLHKSAQLPAEFAILEARLLQNLNEARIYGNDSTNRVEWARIMSQLIRLANEQLGINFNDLCLPGNSAANVLTPFTRKVPGEQEKLTSTSAQAPSYEGTGKRWAVLVGINTYDDPAYPSLHVCTKDLLAVSKQLIIGGFAPERISTLIDDQAERPTRENILTTLKIVAEATQPDDLLLFYFTGHGDMDEHESYLVARNGYMANLEDTAVSIARVKKIMQSAQARAKVMILDACHAGAALGAKGPGRMSSGFIQRVFEHAAGMAILSSCRQDQLSYEWMKQERSVFTYYLLEALQGQADNDNKGFVTVMDLHRYVTNGVGAWAAHNKYSQSPTIHVEMEREIIICTYV